MKRFLGSATIKDRQHLSRLMTKPTKWHVRPAKSQISLGIRPVWSESSLSAWRKLGSLATYWAHNEDSGQTWRNPRLMWVFAGRTVILMVLSWGGSFLCTKRHGRKTWNYKIFRSMTTQAKLPVRPMKTQISLQLRHPLSLSLRCALWG